jgi:hypothetical protein
MSAATRPAIGIERRFHSPPHPGHGGHACRLLARELHGAAHAASSPRLGFAHRPFATCLRCGPNRAEG